MNTTQQNSTRTFGAIALIGLGVLFLAGQLFDFNIWGIFDIGWPFFIIIPGALMLFAAVVANDNKAVGLAVPGAIVTTTGLILLVQETTDHYESWAYAWALYPTVVGLATMYIGQRTGKASVIDGGRKAAMSGVAMFIGFGVFFELFIFNDFVNWDFIVPLLLIGAGLFMLFRRQLPGFGGDDKPKNDEPVFVNGKRKNGNNGVSADVNPSLRRQIDEALAEDDPDQPTRA